jgi:hypothetical protein
MTYTFIIEGKPVKVEYTFHRQEKRTYEYLGSPAYVEIENADSIIEDLEDILLSFEQE